MSKLYFLFLILLFGCKEVDDKRGKVIGVKDGDTIEILFSGKKNVVVRLSDIDCPEKSQPFGKAAKQFTSDLCFGKEVKLVSEGKSGGWGRILGTVFIYDTVCLNKELVKAGLAWHFKKYSKDEEYSAIEIQAREQAVGLWSEVNPIAPWEWRHHKNSN